MKYLNLYKKTEKPKDYVLFLCIICVLILTLSHILGMSTLVIIGIVVYLCIMAFCDSNLIIPCMLFFLPWSPIIKISPNTITFTSVATLILITRCIILGWNVQWKSIIPMIILFVLTLFSKMIHGYSVSTSYFMFFATMLMLSYLLTNIKDKTDFEKCIMYYSLGIIIAAIVVIVFQDNRSIKDYINIQSDLYITKRLTGFNGDANFYSAQIVPAFAGTLIIICQNKKRAIGFAILAVLLVGFGSVAVSKSFLICVLIVFVCFFFSMLKTNGRNIFKIIPVIGLFILIIIRSDFFSYIVDSYTTRFTVATDMDKLTTGRDLLWQEYLGFMIENPIELIFGQGLTAVSFVSHGSHNTVIQSLYQLGIVGCVVLSVWFYEITQFKNNKKNFSLMILWVAGCFLMWLGLDILFFDDFYCVLALFCIGLKIISNEKEKNRYNNETNGTCTCRYFIRNK